jgi:hypothetical protein
MLRLVGAAQRARRAGAWIQGAADRNLANKSDKSDMAALTLHFGRCILRRSLPPAQLGGLPEIWAFKSLGL